MRIPTVRLLFLGVTTAICTAAVGYVAEESDAVRPYPGQLLREGTEIESRPATCRFTGDRLSVEIEGLERPILALENLAAQRVLDAVRDDPNDSRWLLNGTITEFRGSNYLLIEKVKRSNAEEES